MESGKLTEFIQPMKKTNKQTKANVYRAIWRWHFYAGIIFAPFLVILAFTGSVYLFKPQIEQMLYKDYYEVTKQEERILPSEQINIIKSEYPGSKVTSYLPGDSETRSSEVNIIYQNKSLTIFVDPYTGNILGKLNSEEKIMDKIEEIHGELMAGTVGDRIVELAACWAIVLIITGIYLWFPQKKKKGFSGIIFPRFNKGKTILRRDLHAVPAFWITGGLLFLILTGLPWSGFWGTNFQSLVTNTGAGYPPSIWVGNAPTSTIKTKDIADVPWAAENLDVPKSDIQGYTPISIDDVINIANSSGIHKSFSVIFPTTKEGVYTLSAFPPKAKDEATIHIDQYTGAILADYRYDNYGPLGKIIATGITIHKGTEFGLFNQLLSLFICLGTMLVALTGVYMWWKRKPKKELGAPKASSIKKMRYLLFILIALGIIFPLVGLSLIIVWLVDSVVIQRIPLAKKLFNA
ncbi:PepSY-associated TM helix domain-containing protein [Niallia taxi]|uniref:PepSY-associated TM helix domain-containing protein n=1 Tax=Niallia taxi TaxID=2499688 RepID=UPI002E1B7BA7|nr:PepSY domain-containing protein [Niallia taxi]